MAARLKIMAGGLVAALVLMGLVAAVAAPPAKAQGVPAPDAEKVAAMAPLDFLTGEWAGAGWVEFEPGQRFTFRQTEDVRLVAGREVLIIHGMGFARMGPPGTPETVTHDAFAVIDTAPGGGHRMRTWRMGGHVHDVEVEEVAQHRFVWGFDIPGMGRTRYTITLNEAGQWFEAGEMSRDGGESWRQFFEMTLDMVE